MTELDYKTMDSLLEKVCEQFSEGIINTLELGVHKGDTSRGIRDFFNSKKRINFHTGIDNQRDFVMDSPFPECRFIIGNTSDVYGQVRDRSQHFLFVDACHNYPMTMLDHLLYSEKVVAGGIIAFHDTGRHISPFTDYQGMGSKEDPDMYISCRKALLRLGLLPSIQRIDADGYKLIVDIADDSKHTGGITAFVKTK
jgi:hypothetical protein